MQQLKVCCSTTCKRHRCVVVLRAGATDVFTCYLLLRDVNEYSGCCWRSRRTVASNTRCHTLIFYEYLRKGWNLCKNFFPKTGSLSLQNVPWFIFRLNFVSSQVTSWMPVCQTRRHLADKMKVIKDLLRKLALSFEILVRLSATWINELHLLGEYYR